MTEFIKIIPSIIIILSIGFTAVHLSKLYIDKLFDDKKIKSVMEYSELMHILDDIFDEIVTNKYLFHYNLSNTRVIPDTTKEIEEITLDVYESFSQAYLDNITFYITKESFMRIITRKARLWLVAYTTNNISN